MERGLRKPDLTASSTPLEVLEEVGWQRRVSLALHAFALLMVIRHKADGAGASGHGPEGPLASGHGPEGPLQTEHATVMLP